MDLGVYFKSLLNSALQLLSLPVRFTWFGHYFSFTIFHIMLGVLIISLGIVLFYKIISK